MKHVPLMTAALVGIFAITGAACSDDDGGAGGTSGTGAAAGSAGSGGSGASAGSGGASGTGATGGTGASGGAGGSGGTGGSSSGGTGGSPADRCEACLQQECSAAVSACEGNADCAAILECMIEQSCGEIPDPQECFDDCIALSPDGESTFTPVSECVLGDCFTDCSGS